jgi:hypothetical protein
MGQCGLIEVGACAGRLQNRQRTYRAHVLCVSSFSAVEELIESHSGARSRLVGSFINIGNYERPIVPAVQVLLGREIAGHKPTFRYLPNMDEGPLSSSLSPAIPIRLLSIHPSPLFVSLLTT